MVRSKVDVLASIRMGRSPYGTCACDDQTVWARNYQEVAVTHPRSILRVLVVGLLSGLLFFPVAGLRSSLAQETGQGAIAYDSTFSDAVTQSPIVALDAGTQCPQDTIAYWAMDETSGPPYEDSYNGHDGLCAGACPSSAAGQIDGGQAFDGISTGINVPAHAAFDWARDDSFSIGFWMYRNGSTGRNEVVVGRDDSSSSLHWWVGLSRDDRGRGYADFTLRDTAGNLYWVEGTTVLNTGGWHHVVAVREGSAGRLRIYVDGALEGTTSGATYAAGFASPTKGINIGWLDRSPYQYRFGGILDELAIYDQALGASEIASQYAAGRAGWGACSSPSIAVAKTADPTIIYVGESVVYSYAVTNDGNVPLLNLNVADDKCSPVTQTGSGDVQLDPGEVWNYTCSTPLSEDTINTVTASGTYTYPLSGTTSVTGTASVDVIDPDIVVSKTADPAIIYAGDQVTYGYTVTNNGNDTLENIGLVDDKCAPVNPVGPDDRILNPGETKTYTCATQVYGDTTNTATFSGTDRLGTTWRFTRQAFVDVLAPDITVEKTANPESIVYGDTVAYTYVVHNSGSDRLLSTNMADDKCAPVNPVGSDDGILDPDEIQTYTCATALYGNTTNVGTFSGLDLLGRSWSFTDTAFVSMRGPQIAVAKTASAPGVRPGEVVEYTYEVTNPGGEPLSNVRVEDDKCTSMSAPAGDDGNGKLDLRETWTYTCSMALYQTTTNTAIAYGTPSVGAEIHSPPVQVTVQVYVAYVPIVMRAFSR